MMLRMRSISSQVVKHIPQRTCVACRQVRAQRELVRLVRRADGGVAVDAVEKRVGRGAYLCRAPECWQIGLKKGRLERALGTSLTQDNRVQLIKYGEDIPEVAS